MFSKMQWVLGHQIKNILLFRSKNKANYVSRKFFECSSNVFACCQALKSHYRQPCFPVKTTYYILKPTYSQYELDEHQLFY